MNKENNNKNILSDEEIKKLVIARLSVLPPDVSISFGSDGNFTRDQLLESVEKGDKIGEKLAEIEMEWLRSFKKNMHCPKCGDNFRYRSTFFQNVYYCCNNCDYEKVFARENGVKTKEEITFLRETGLF